MLKGGEGAFGMSYFVSFTFTLHSVLRSVCVTLLYVRCAFKPFFEAGGASFIP